MAMDFTQWSTLSRMLGQKPSWVPVDEQDRIAAYEKYDEIYWNDPTQFSLRVLEGEQPLYIPNARIVVDTTSSFVLKGLTLSSKDSATQAALDQLLDREMFYPRFEVAKHAGVARGDYVIHLSANPQKVPGTRISMNSVDPSMVFPIYDENQPDKMIACHLAHQYELPDDQTIYVRRLTYRLDLSTGQKRVLRSEGVYKVEPKWYGAKAELVKEIIPEGLLDSAITSIPVYWFKNRDWEGDLYGSSELRGMEAVTQAISQGSTDINMALALNGLGVYATDGGRPVRDDGTETDWEVAPGRVMEVPAGSYFRRVEGVGSITPAKDHIDYLEEKLFSASGITDIALGKADVAIASSGIALAIKFMPTLAKVEERDRWGVARLKQLFYDWKIWHGVFENQQLVGDIAVELGDKLPTDRTARFTELNNMIDRHVISTKYYREEVKKLGYVFPPEIEAEIMADMERDKAMKSVNSGENNPESTIDEGNQSNNKDRPNESAGTEQNQSAEQQARGGKPQ